jgi:uncharacterized protein (DUF2252 family)
VLDTEQSQRIIAVVCDAPPEGQARWSVRLIASEAIKRKLAREWAGKRFASFFRTTL